MPYIFDENTACSYLTILVHFGYVSVLPHRLDNVTFLQFVPGTLDLDCQPPVVPPTMTGFTESQMFGAEPSAVSEIGVGPAYTGAVDDVWDDGPTFSGAVSTLAGACQWLIISRSNLWAQ
jgi:hypothetical protein